MTQEQRLDFLIRYLLSERKVHPDAAIPSSLPEKRRLLRSLMNARPPAPIGEDFLAVQDAYLRERLAKRGVTSVQDLTPAQPGLYLWQGDITTLAADAIVNAANCQAEIAIRTVRAWRQQHPNAIEVIFNVFKDSDAQIYRQLLR